MVGAGAGAGAGASALRASRSSGSSSSVRRRRVVGTELCNPTRARVSKPRSRCVGGLGDLGRLALGRQAILELAQTAAEAAAGLRQALGAEDQQRDDGDDDELGRADG